MRGIGLYIGDKTSYYVLYCVYTVTSGFHFTSYRWINMFTSISRSTLGPDRNRGAFAFVCCEKKEGKVYYATTEHIINNNNDDYY